MFTDWSLIARAAEELSGLLAGSRVREVGQLGDGRFALVLWKAGREDCLAVDVFAPTPLVTLETDLPVVQADPGFFRSAAATLSGMPLTQVKARRGDRMICVEFSRRSRFGVENGASLIFELVPRFGNIILLKGGTIVAALKEFSFAQNASRQVAAGHAYE
ncbi:MAG: NFACT family protein, partial [Candidatus Eremiobacteraeota bacterium]|nr:NFACT family protein [Candidatus Eremiobacteraeota bacterium]